MTENRRLSEVLHGLERENKIKLERELAEIRARSAALIWLGTEQELIDAITRFFKAGQLKAGDLQDALAKARLNFVGTDGKFIIKSSAPGTSPVRLTPLDEKYQVIEFDGRQYDLTKVQAAVIKVLHAAHHNKRSSVGLQEIYKAMNVRSGKMSQWFRGKNKSLYGKLIVQTASRYHYRLDI